MDLNEISVAVIKAAIKVHTELGPGLLESVYQSCMEIELKAMGLRVDAQNRLRLYMRGKRLRMKDFVWICWLKIS